MSYAKKIMGPAKFLVVLCQARTIFLNKRYDTIWQDKRKVWLWLFSSSKLHIQISEDNSFNRHKKVNGGKRSLEFHKNFRFGCFSLSLSLLFLSKPFSDNVRCYNRKKPAPWNIIQFNLLVFVLYFFREIKPFYLFLMF